MKDGRSALQEYSQRRKELVVACAVVLHATQNLKVVGELLYSVEITTFPPTTAAGAIVNGSIVVYHISNQCFVTKFTNLLKF